MMHSVALTSGGQKQIVVDQRPSTQLIPGADAKGQVLLCSFPVNDPGCFRQVFNLSMIGQPGRAVLTDPVSARSVLQYRSEHANDEKHRKHHVPCCFWVPAKM
jgi:hypothetical protein